MDKFERKLEQKEKKFNKEINLLKENIENFISILLMQEVLSNPSSNFHKNKNSSKKLNYQEIYNSYNYINTYLSQILLALRSFTSIKFILTYKIKDLEMKEYIIDSKKYVSLEKEIQNSDILVNALEKGNHLKEHINNIKENLKGEITKELTEILNNLYEINCYIKDILKETTKIRDIKTAFIEFKKVMKEINEMYPN